MIPPGDFLVTSKGIEEFLPPNNIYYPLTESYELGGVALRDSTQGLLGYVWHGWTDGTTVWVQREGLPPTEILTGVNISEIDLTFDQNMNVCLAYVEGGMAKLYWYDTQVEVQITTELTGVSHPRVSLDDKRGFNVADSDIILAYQKGDTLLYSLQRDRFVVEYPVATANKTLLWRIGMGKNNRFIFYWR